MYQKASNIEQYQKAKKKFQSAKGDVGYVASEHDKAINEGIRKCDSKIKGLSPSQKDSSPAKKGSSPSLTVNGSASSTDISFSASGGSKTLTISTNQGTPSASALPYWITVSNISATTMTIRCSSNNGSSPRLDWFNINAGGKTVRVNVSQSGQTDSGSSNSVNTPNGEHGADIESVWIEQNVLSNGKQGLNVHTKFKVNGMKGLDGRVSTYYYDADGNAIKDTNDSYCTDGVIPKVAASEDFKPSYDKSIFEDFIIFIPYSELHQTGTSPRSILVSVAIWDNSEPDHKILAINEYTPFTFTPKSGSSQSDSHLTVDGKTAVSTSFTASGGIQKFEIRTDAGSWSTWGVPPFCEVINKTPTSFTLKCNPNNTGSKRSDYMTVKNGNHEVRIDISQELNSSTKINRIWIEHNTYNDGERGMMIHLDFETHGLKNHSICPTAYFHYSNGDPVIDCDGICRAAGGQVAVFEKSIADYDRTNWSDFKLFMPYDQLHLGSGSYSLKFQIQVWDYTTDKLIIVSEYQGFTYSR